MRSVLGTTVAVIVACLLLLQVARAQQVAPIDPAEGFWYDPERPGSGFSLDRRGDVVVLTAYDFESPGGDARWRNAVAPLVDAALDARLESFEGGNCLGCAETIPAQALEGGSVLHLEFDSARSALLQVDDAPPRPFISVPYGHAYVDAPFDTAGVPLPDLRGRWVFGSPAIEHAGTFEVTSMQVQDTTVVFGGSALAPPQELYIACEVLPSDVAGCRILATWGSPPIEIGTFALGDITEQRMTGTVGPNGALVVAHRIGASEVQP